MGKYLVSAELLGPQGCIDIAPLRGHIRDMRAHYQLLILTVLALDASSHYGIATISMSAIANDVGCSPATVSNAITSLVSRGWIEELEHENVRGYITDTERWEIFARDRYRCQYCGRDRGPFVVDHVIPVALGGSNAQENLTTSCPPCNRKKAARFVEAHDA